MSLTGKLAAAAGQIGKAAFQSGFAGNMLTGAAAGGTVGALNPMGSNGFFGGGIRGAIYGAGLGAAGMGGLKAARKWGGVGVSLGKGNLRLGTNTGRFMIKSNEGLKGLKGIRKAGNIGLAGGALGGLVGGAARGRQARRKNTTIASNAWKNGTHPMYFR